jgi:hypothetical protein
MVGLVGRIFHVRKDSLARRGFVVHDYYCFGRDLFSELLVFAIRIHAVGTRCST